MSGDKLVESFGVASTLTAQRVVYSSANNTVAYLDTNTSLPLGITIDTVLDTTQAIPVQLNGRAYLYFNDTVTSGAQVTADASGRGIPFTAATAPSAYIGTLIGPTVAATGTVAEVLINPGFKSIP